MSHVDKCVQLKAKQPESLEQAILLGLSDAYDGELGEGCGCKKCRETADLIIKRIEQFLKQQQQNLAERMALLSAPTHLSTSLH